jgi:lysozyme family protein
MANFNEALHLTAINEGGYANDPADHGGETYAGISRKFWPNWQGWLIIDDIFATNTQYTSHAISFINDDEELKELAQQFYKHNFWDVNKLDQINDQQLADSVYDFGVNSGVGKAAKILQEAIAYLYPKDRLTVDGMIGNQTINACNNGVPYLIYAEFNGRRKEFYEKLATNPTQHKFLASWLSRIKPYQA